MSLTDTAQRAADSVLIRLAGPVVGVIVIALTGWTLREVQSTGESVVELRTQITTSLSPRIALLESRLDAARQQAFDRRDAADMEDRLKEAGKDREARLNREIDQMRAQVDLLRTQLERAKDGDRSNASSRHPQ